jgi:hypothetical protein
MVTEYNPVDQVANGKVNCFWFAETALENTV